MNTPTVFAVVSGKGGVGKTTLVALLGAALARRGQRVVVIDADVGLRNLELMLGLPWVPYDLLQWSQGLCSLEQSLVAHPQVPGLSLIASPQRIEPEAAPNDTFARLTRALSPWADTVLIDAPAGIGRGFRQAISASQRAILVSTPDRPAARDADRVAGLLLAEGHPEPKLLLNRVRPSAAPGLAWEQVVEALGLPLLGLIPECEQLHLAGCLGQLAPLSAPGALALEPVAARWGELMEVPGRLAAEREPFGASGEVRA